MRTPTRRLWSRGRRDLTSSPTTFQMSRPVGTAEERAPAPVQADRAQPRSEMFAQAPVHLSNLDENHEPFAFVRGPISDDIKPKPLPGTHLRGA